MFERKIRIEFKPEQTKIYKYVNDPQYEEFLKFVKNEMIEYLNKQDYKGFEIMKQFYEKLLHIKKSSWFLKKNY